MIAFSLPCSVLRIIWMLYYIICIHKPLVNCYGSVQSWRMLRITGSNHLAFPVLMVLKAGLLIIGDHAWNQEGSQKKTQRLVMKPKACFLYVLPDLQPQ